MMSKKIEHYNVVVIGAGVSGASQAYALARYTNCPRIAIFEKESSAGRINSNKRNNSQTLHEGEIETNYTLEKATAIKHKAYFTRAYVLGNTREGLFLRGGRMVLGVGKMEVEFLEERFLAFKNLFPELKKLNRDEIATLEPSIIAGRPADEAVIALYREDGLTIDFGLLAEELLSGAQNARSSALSVFTNTPVCDIETMPDGKFLIKTNDQYVVADFLSICAGAHSMCFAKKLGLESAAHTSILCVAGNFYYTRKVLNSKVYTLQDPKLPFSAVHGDPDIIDPLKTRYGPTTRIVFQLERGVYKTTKDFLKSMRPFLRTLRTYSIIMCDKKFFMYAIKHNIFFQLPGIGIYLFAKEVQKIIPTISSSDITFAKNQGGIRPQIIDTKSTTPLSLGEAKLAGRNLLVNVTPSPGATTSVYNGLVDVKKISETLRFDFYEDKVLQDFHADTLS